MKKANIYLILSFLMNVLFWCTLVSVSIILALAIFIGIDPSFLKEIDKLRISIGVLDLQITETSPYLTLIHISFMVLGGLFSALMLWNFKVLFRNTGNGLLFVKSNARAIFMVGIIMLISSLISNIPLFYIANKVAPLMHLAHGNIAISYSINKPLFISSIFIILLGLFFNKAIKISEENELTI